VLTNNSVNSRNKGVIILELSEREEKILSAIIEHFIATGEPVGSKFLAESLPMTVSSATIRNEMAYLSEIGFLTQPHTSAGRIPADKGYRYYIEKLLMNYTPSDSDMFRISNGIDTEEGDPREVLSQACSILSDLTGCTTVATTPSGEEAVVTGTKVVPIGPRAVMTVITTSNGALKSRVAKTDNEPDYETLQLFFNTVATRFSDKRLGEITPATIQTACASLGTKSIDLMPLMVSFAECVRDALQGDVIVKGTDRILHNHVLRSDAAGITQLLCSQEELIRLFEMKTDERIETRIGNENEYQCLSNAAIIRTAYKIGEFSKGSIGVISSTKTDYSGIIPLIRYTSDVLSDVLTGTISAIQ